MTALALRPNGTIRPNRRGKNYAAKHAQLASEVRRDQPERRLQITIVNAFRDILPADVWFCHIPNGGKRPAFEAVRLKAMGVRKGAPDLCLVYQGGAYFMELKAGRGKLSEAQTDCRVALKRAGAFVETVRTLDEALECLNIWNIPTRVRAAA